MISFSCFFKRNCQAILLLILYTSAITRVVVVFTISMHWSQRANACVLKSSG